MKDYANRIQISDNHQQNETMNDEDIDDDDQHESEKWKKQRTKKSWMQSDKEGVNFKSKLNGGERSPIHVCTLAAAALISFLNSFFKF